jgi:hypothetical protein
VKRAQLESLGMTDNGLAAEYESYFEVRPELDGTDTPAMQQRRRMAFDAVTLRAMGPFPEVNHAPLGPFGLDEPAIHAAAKRT